MTGQLDFECDQHENPWECSDAVVCQTSEGYGLPIHDGGTSYIQIQFCPWCGASLREGAPSAQRKLELDDMDIDDPDAMAEMVGYFKEDMAKVVHETWAHWTRYMLMSLGLPDDGSVGCGDPIGEYQLQLADRWWRQIRTVYDELSEKEKDSDRRFAEKFAVTAAPYIQWFVQKAAEVPKSEEAAIVPLTIASHQRLIRMAKKVVDAYAAVERTDTCAADEAFFGAVEELGDAVEEAL
jgi:hypothetical protein